MSRQKTLDRLDVRVKDALIRRAKPWARRLRPQKVDVFAVRDDMPNQGPGLALSLYQSLGVALVPGHRVELCDNGAVFDTLLSSIEAARDSVHILLYIWTDGEASRRVVKAVCDKARAGVTCRVLVDAFGSARFARTVAPRLLDAGCEVRVFRPLPGKNKLARNHRKLVICDGRVALTGGFGVRDDWLGDGVHGDAWRDANVRFEGPAVSAAQQAFAENWQEAGGSLLPQGAFPVLEPCGQARAALVTSTGAVVSRAERLMQLTFSAAQTRLWTANPYFVPSRGIVEILCRKAQTGVDVRVLVPSRKSDSKTAFLMQRKDQRELQRCGVRIFEYQPSMMHAKTVLVDDALSVVGSINLEPLSLGTLEEASLVIEDADFARALERTLASDFTRSQEIAAPRGLDDLVLSLLRRKA